MERNTTGMNRKAKHALHWLGFVRSWEGQSRTMCSSPTSRIVSETNLLHNLRSFGRLNPWCRWAADSKEGKDYEAAPAFKGSLTDARKVPVTKPNDPNIKILTGREKALCQVLEY
eukprot:713475-Pelagomonas_calceolata.AAC.2